MRNLVLCLFKNGRIRTTLPKAKEGRKLAERIITLAKKGTLHHRRQAISKLGSTSSAQEAIKWAFEELKTRYANTNGGYTRILHLPRTIRQIKADLPLSSVAKRSNIYGTRLGDNSPMVLWELCDPNAKKPDRPKRQKKVRKPKEKAAPTVATATAAKPDAPKA